METTFNKLDRVWNLDVGLGTVRNIRDDGRGIPILTIALDDATQTPDGWYIAREWEVLNLFQFLTLQLSEFPRIASRPHGPRLPGLWPRLSSSSGRRYRQPGRSNNHHL